jgi:hypothetical protein
MYRNSSLQEVAIDAIETEFSRTESKAVCGRRVSLPLVRPANPGSLLTLSNARSMESSASSGWLPDVNVWLSLCSDRHEHHAAAVVWLETVRAPLIFLPIEANGFAAVAHEFEGDGRGRPGSARRGSVRKRECLDRCTAGCFRRNPGQGWCRFLSGKYLDDSPR